MSPATFQAHNPATGEVLPPQFHTATPAAIHAAVERAAAAAEAYAELDGATRAAFLRAIATQLEAITPALVATAGQESGLPAPRLTGEAARTCNQLRLFADLVADGSWVDARLDRTQDRANGPRKPDLRSMLRPLGPVAVFGASNFPLAFSVAGGDTASALAAGNPVVVKAHPAHPATSALAAGAIQAAVAELALPEGVFAILYDAGIEVGKALVQHPLIKAVGFTGSTTGGRALMDLAAARPEPIPVYAEMGSINPVFVLPGALRERGDAIAAGLHASVTLGGGQFCTKPGLVLVPAGAAAEPFVMKLAELMAASPAFTLLTRSIAEGFASGAARRASHAAIQALGQPAQPLSHPGAGAAAFLFQTDARSFLNAPELAHELFGPATLIVRHDAQHEIEALARGLSGHLTATVHGTEDDLREHAGLLRILATKVGRIVFNGFPTGVEVTDAMIHGGPYPATSDGRSTSVGTQAIFRFARPVCYQDAPQFLLPAALRDENPLNLWRHHDSQLRQG